MFIYVGLVQYNIEARRNLNCLRDIKVYKV